MNHTTVTFFSQLPGEQPQGHTYPICETELEIVKANFSRERMMLALHSDVVACPECLRVIGNLLYESATTLENVLSTLVSQLEEVRNPPNPNNFFNPVDLTSSKQKYETCPECNQRFSKGSGIRDLHFQKAHGDLAPVPVPA